MFNCMGGPIDYFLKFMGSYLESTAKKSISFYFVSNYYINFILCCKSALLIWENNLGGLFLHKIQLSHSKQGFILEK